ncbi:RDD family protein [Streptomyces sp. NPDC094448]|uniref:RDD family protein n=1 Tax=Streptomyces sp. NPDC094448 TaxID=3366063 RepID=UPI003809CEC7
MGALGTPTDEGGNVPGQGYYPDPSIPGYVRYWNGAAWVPGTSRPAPEGGAATPAPVALPAPVVPAAEETGPVFLDELDGLDGLDEGPGDEPVRSEPASAWQADTSRQSGFGGEPGRVDWGGARVPAQPPAPGADPTGGALPGVRSTSPAVPEPAAEAPAPVRATPQVPAAPEPPAAAAPAPAPVRPAPEGAVTLRPVPPQAPQAPQAFPAPQPQAPQAFPAPQPQAPQAFPAPQPHPHPHPHPLVPEQAQPVRPPVVTEGSGGGAASWAQQPPEAPVIPWKPPVNDPFLAIAQAQAAARPAGLGRRLAARLIDTAVLGTLVGAVAVPLLTSAIDHINTKIEAAERSGETVTVWLLDGTTGVQLGIVLAALLVLGALYEALPTAKWGRTLGKKLCGVSVADIESHEPPPFGAALRRWLVYSGLGLIAVGLVNVVWCLFDRPWRQCWHDKAARTYVKG